MNIQRDSFMEEFSSIFPAEAGAARIMRTRNRPSREGGSGFCVEPLEPIVVREGSLRHRRNVPRRHRLDSLQRVQQPTPSHYVPDPHIGAHIVVPRCGHAIMPTSFGGYPWMRS